MQNHEEPNPLARGTQLLVEQSRTAMSRHRSDLAAARLEVVILEGKLFQATLENGAWTAVAAVTGIDVTGVCAESQL